MAAIAIQAGKTVSPVNEYAPIMKTYIAGEALTTGVAVKLNSSGQAVKSVAADAVGVQLGIVIGAGALAVGNAVTVMARGVVDGYDLSALAYGALAFAGAAGVVDTAGTIALGRVTAMSEYGGSKVLEVLL
jgi:hypothetical protein